MDLEDESRLSLDREHMFDKVVTPSDVGKLNRLVIPKQHAEKHFPLGQAASDKGLLLSFEDNTTGKPWSFRYSYWNSSQSYVMTKGWSRFVKDKHLDAGDVVSFLRGTGPHGRDRLYIACARRPPAAPPMLPVVAAHAPPPVFWPSAAYVSPQMLYLRAGVQALEPVVRAQERKRVRLFGVNLECPQAPEGESGGGSDRTVLARWSAVAAAAEVVQGPRPVPGP
ncbi:hypothetical protein AMTRI_Chr09g16990 [Amborella trichopoda]|uniref:TF-B3 domain-containing protein n=1 Tax=Amborella trichopoda TaxID=13333 RepID=W1PJC4_AMBTC|nr:B3 domain-containing protein Os03g0120900 [Amborella trichopoda]ERN08103.1 hypothetical protein AMTR_s00018p00040300 [Amborella trichopoda]|eukprot:XP_011624188.1 B3 domain-containing protein Os03g0120900 [Amborella trichopoda]